MHDAVAATEVVCDASRKLVANAMHCQTTRLQAPRGCGWSAICCTVVVCVGNRREETRVTSPETRNNRFLGFLLLVGGAGFPSPSAKQLVKSASTFLSAFRLLPRLEEVYIHRVHTKPQPPRFAEKWFTNSQVGLVSGTLYP